MSVWLLLQSTRHPGDSRAMGRHVTEDVMEMMAVWQSGGVTPDEIHNRLLRKSVAVAERVPSFVAARRTPRGQTFKRSAAEARDQSKSFPWRACVLLTPFCFVRCAKGTMCSCWPHTHTHTNSVMYDSGNVHTTTMIPELEQCRV